LRISVLYIFFLLFTGSHIIGQTVEPSSGIPLHNLQLEFEALYSVETESFNKETSWSVPNILVRYGLSNNIELQLHTPFTQVRCFENNQLISNEFTFDEIEFGVSVNLWSQNKFIPEAAIMARIITPVGKLNSNSFGNMVSLNFSNVVSSKTSIHYNLGTTTDFDKNTFGFYTVNLTYQTHKNLRFFIENSGMFNKNTKSNCLGSGFGFNVIKNFSVDVSVAKSLKRNMYYTGVIKAWVINTK
jgi:hypothetical protein